MFRRPLHLGCSFLMGFGIYFDACFSVYEGVDYSNKANRADAAGGAMPFQFIDTGKRERKKIASYKEDNFYRADRPHKRGCRA